jgi:hypothetical protein
MGRTHPHQRLRSRWEMVRSSAGWHGVRAEPLIPKIRYVIETFRFRSYGDYSAWPGPNSNTFVQAALDSVPALRAVLPPTVRTFLTDSRYHRCHCLGDTITSSGVAGWLGCRPRRRINCWCADWWNSVQRLRLRPGLRLLWRTGVRLLRRPCLLRRVHPSVRLRSRILRRRIWIELLCSRLLRSRYRRAYYRGYQYGW